ncbi:MAG: acyltransferase family protein [Hyphomicrobiales bacterium]
MQSFKSKHLPQVDALRAIAVLVVVIYHFAPAYLPGGYIGVDVFFVISGFVIARGYQDLLQNRKISLLKFFTKRLKRLFPAVAFLIFCSSVYAVFALSPLALIEFGFSVFSVALLSQNIYFWSVGDYFSGPLNKPLLHLWSLAVEEQFYLLWPAVLIALSRFRKIGLIFFAILLLSFFTGYVLENRSPKTVFYWLPFRIWQFGLGILAFNLCQKKLFNSHFLSDKFILPVCISFVVFFSFIGGTWTDFPGMGNSLLCVIVAVTLISAHTSAGQIPKLAQNKIVLLIGRISYSWYLWHWPPLSFFYIQFGRSASVMEGVLISFATLLLAYGSYRLVERPFREASFSVASLIKLWVFVSCIFLSFGFLVYDSKGWVQRYPTDLRPLLLAKLEGDTSRCSYIKLLQNPGSEFCRIYQADVDRPTVLFVGDSHVAVIQDTLHSMGKNLNISILMTTRNCDLGRYGTFAFCSDDVFERLLSQTTSASVDAVVTMSFWELDLFSSKEMSEEIARLATLDVPIFIVETVPNSSHFLPQTRIDDFYETGRVDLSGISRETYDLFITPTNHVLSTAIEMSGTAAQLLKPRDYICSSVECPFSMDGEVLYFDSNHLTHRGAALLVPMFEDALESVSLK